MPPDVDMEAGVSPPTPIPPIESNPPPSSSSAATTTTTKPKSAKQKPRSPSPSPPPPPPPPLQTIRLQIRLGGPQNYEVDIASIAKATGQRPPTPVIVKRDTSDSEGEDEDQPDGKEKTKPKKKKKNAASEYYDVSDPFIDDSELALDERTFFAQTKQQGFYVSSGEVALLKDKTPKKPKTVRKSLLPIVNSSSDAGPSKRQEGTKDAPISLTSDHEDARRPKSDPGDGDDGDEGGERAGQKRKRYITVVEGGKKRKVVDVQSFHPELQAEIEIMKQAIASESWETKGKFPPSLKPRLATLALLAVKLDEYDEHFFNLMPVLFPYNKFTMSKLIKRTIFHEHVALLMQRQETLLADLAEQASTGFAKAKEEWEKSVVAWDRRQEKVKAEAEAGGGPGVEGVGAPTDSAAPTRHPTEEMEVDPGHQPQDHRGPSAEDDGEERKGSTAGGGKDGAAGIGKDGAAAAAAAAKDTHPPAKKFRLTDSMKVIVWQLVLLSNECCRLENEKNTLEGSVLQVSEQGLRKILYQKIVAAFPEGWMSSGQISRDVSAMKKRFEKEAMDND